MTYKSILTVRSSRDGTTTALDQAVELVKRNDGHLEVLCLGVDRTRTGYYDATVAAVAITSLLENARAEMQEIATDTTERLKASGVPFAVASALVPLGDLPRIVGHHARFNDLVVMPLPYREGQSAEVETIVETALFDARCPVLVVPRSER